MNDYQFVQTADNDGDRAARDFCEAFEKHIRQGFTPVGNVSVTHVSGGSVANPSKILYTQLMVRCSG